jgi:hypothetical protein
MKRTLLACVLVASMGCETIGPFLDTRGSTVSVTAPEPIALPTGPITADVVEPANAHRIAEAVWDEMDRDLEKPARKR